MRLGRWGLLVLSAFLASALRPSRARAELSEVEFKSVSVDSAAVRADADPGSAKLWKVWKYAPMEVVSFRGEWVHVRDFEGDEGWLRRAQLSDNPTVLVRAKEGKVRSKPSPKAKVQWVLDQGYALRVFGARGDWYEVSDLEDVSGWINRKETWGFPPPAKKKPGE